MAQFESLVAANKARSAVLVAVFILLYTGLFFAIFFSVIVLLWGWDARHDTRLMLAFLLASHTDLHFFGQMPHVLAPLVLGLSFSAPA